MASQTSSSQMPDLADGQTTCGRAISCPGVEYFVSLISVDKTARYGKSKLVGGLSVS